MKPQFTKEARIDFWTVAKYVITGAFLAMLFRRIVKFLLSGLRTNEDRPPIIVREGSITFEHKIVKGKQLDWDGQQNHWTPKQPNGKKVDFLVARVLEGGSSECPSVIESESLEITYSTGLKTEKFWVFLAGGKPMLRPKGLLSRDSQNPKKLTHGVPGSGNITNIRPQQGGLECNLSSEAVIEIGYAYEEDDE